MPLLKFHLYLGRTPEEVGNLLDVVHEVMVGTFNVPAADRYQLVLEYASTHMKALDTGLGITRSEKFLLLEVLSRPRGREAKVNFYKGLAAALQSRCGISPSDLMVSFIENSDEDWSFGRGDAQFLTGELR
ncbi:tautomerase family protein [Rhizobium pusense]|uniref:tautomerase family protein n=1 Tax=Agrobacterium pusense TaxID=648995 RepID=UPI00244AF743|nr:tautomerase family protein [Agrobacterium pusense]MDH0117788.1 tautomerase family protein [Agrobacterium pusense]